MFFLIFIFGIFLLAKIFSRKFRLGNSFNSILYGNNYNFDKVSIKKI